MLNKSNMYDWITGTWNPVGGQCPHDCNYCYVKGFRFPSLKAKYSGMPRLIEHELKKNLGKDKFWFVGSCIDIFANEIPPRWKDKILYHCGKFNNRYLFQTKSPQYMLSCLDRFPFPKNTVLGTTIETNRIYPQMGKTPTPGNRAASMNTLRIGHEIMVTIEPIMNFDTDLFLRMISMCQPKWVNIGADSGGHNLPEPPAGKMRELIAELSKFTEVKPKKNLNRILKGEP